LAFRDSPLSALKTPIIWAAAVVAVLVGVLALALLLTDHRTKAEGAYGVARGEFDEALEPVSNVIAAPFHWIGDASDYLGGYVLAVHQNRELKKQVLELQRWHDAAIALKNLNLRYESLLRLRTEPPIPMATARVVSDARGPFSDARLADAGSNAGVQVGNPAMSEDGVVGRVIGVTSAASRILLLTDVESRTPVLIDRSNARAILTGDGGPNPKLDFVRGLNAVKDGDVVLTSGDGGLYPRGLPVGVAARDSLGVWRVRLYSDQAAIDFVRILIFNGFSQKVDQAALAASAAALPPLTPEETQQLDAARAAAAKPVPIPSVTAPNAAIPPAAAPTASSAPSEPSVKLERSGEVPGARPAVKAVKHAAKATAAKPKIPKGAYHPGQGG
jgi:rod shape-determining protein MreC